MAYLSPMAITIHTLFNIANITLEVQASIILPVGIVIDHCHF